VVQERVQKLFNLDYDYQNWSWLVDPARLEVPLKVLSPLVPAKDKALVVPLVEEETKSSVRGAVSLASLRQLVQRRDDMVATSTGSEDPKPPSRNASLR